MKSFRSVALALAMTFAQATTPLWAADPFVAVGKQEPITILINSSPWYAGFEKVVELYEQQTKNKVTLDVTPYGGMLEKARNAVRGGESPYDIVNLDTQWTIEFYEGGFLTPLKQIDATFELPPEVLTFGDSGFWNAEKRWRTRSGGTLYAYSPNGTVLLYFYRRDLYEQAGLKPPETWNDVVAACEKLKNPPNLYGAAFRGERGNGIRFDFTPVLLGFGAEFVKDPENGDFTVTVNSPQMKKAIDFYIDLARRCGPPNIGALGQSDMIQLLATGKLVQGHVVVAAFSNFDDPKRSAMVGKIDVAKMPRPIDGTHGAAIGNWHFAVPKNLPTARQKAAVAFSKWFLSYGAQYEYAKAGGIPVRSDVMSSDLAGKPEGRWMKAYVESMRDAKQVLGFVEGAAVENVVGLRFNQALIGELTSAEALNLAAREIVAIFEKSGRKTGMLPPLQ